MTKEMIMMNKKMIKTESWPICEMNVFPSTVARRNILHKTAINYALIKMTFIDDFALCKIDCLMYALFLKQISSGRYTCNQRLMC